MAVAHSFCVTRKFLEILAQFALENARACSENYYLYVLLLLLFL